MQDLSRFLYKEIYVQETAQPSSPPVCILQTFVLVPMFCLIWLCRSTFEHQGISFNSLLCLMFFGAGRVHDAIRENANFWKVTHPCVQSVALASRVLSHRSQVTRTWPQSPRTKQDRCHNHQSQSALRLEQSLKQKST